MRQEDGVAVRVPEVAAQEVRTGVGEAGEQVDAGQAEFAEGVAWWEDGGGGGEEGGAEACPLGVGDGGWQEGVRVCDGEVGGGED